jgi:DNA-binding XRE family transcriptional regulator
VKYRVRVWLDERRKTQRWLAATLGVSEQYLTYILNGKSCPSLPLAARLEQLTGIPAAMFCPDQGRVAS